MIAGQGVVMAIGRELHLRKQRIGALRQLVATTLCKWSVAGALNPL